MNNIVLRTESNLQFNKIWYNILFGEYELARESLRNYSLLSSEFLTFDSKAMINFYKLSGYLNLMEEMLTNLSHFMIKSQQNYWKAIIINYIFML